MSIEILTRPIITIPSDEIDSCKLIYKRIERAGRTCYKSEDKITKESAEKFIRMIIKRGHESVLEHEKISVRIVCSRSCSHQLVRHRLGSYSQESQRYINYTKKKTFSGKSKEGMTVVCPLSIQRSRKTFFMWKMLMRSCYAIYKTLIKLGIQPEDARSVLPNACKTEIVVTYNLRQWRHFLNTRCDPHAQEEIRYVATTILHTFRSLLPAVFEDIKY